MQELLNPTLQAVRDLGGSGTLDEIDARIGAIMELTEDQLSVIHDESRGTQTELSYRAAWARTYLKMSGFLENSSRGVWALTPKGESTERVDETAVVEHYRSKLASRPRRSRRHREPPIEDEELLEEGEWRSELLSVLLEMPPDAFERLAQRLLRESGFIQVEVIGRSGDGGIDGKGIMRVGGLMSFHVIFQCKRYQGVVTAGHVRDFRGAMVGRADKALLITTGTFTRDALAEATRDGAPAIDLIDGDALMDKLKELNLGVRTEMVEHVAIDHDWFLAR